MTKHLPDHQLVQSIEQSEMDYMYDRMIAIQQKPDNPEGIVIERFGHATALFSRTMPWPSFNTVKGLKSEDIEYVNQIIQFYRQLERKIHIEIVPSYADQVLLKKLAQNGLYQSGFHASMYIAIDEHASLIRSHDMDLDKHDAIRIEDLQEDQFELYAQIHCRGTGLPDSGIPHVSENNRVLYNRPGWNFYIAYVQDQPAAVAVMHVQQGVASLTFAATLPEYRGLGLHRALLKKRISEAVKQKGKLVVGQCAFLSQSHRNMEHVGMKIGYIRAAWSEL